MLLLYFILLFLPTQEEHKEIHFGNGGGFSGMVYHYVLDESGNVYQFNTFSEEKTPLRKIEVEVVDSLWETIDNEKLDEININKPGNMYKFVTFERNGEIHKLVWNGKSENNSLNLLYKELNMLRQLKE